ncbi:MAG: hypothetical protein O3C40_31710 [Planctomycetota bacterium]|nr:hypothetical protein [Planctomycetota bacterium]
MAIDHYVDSAAAGANDGTSWTDAWVLLSSSTGAAAGAEIAVEDGHSESAETTVSVNWTNGTLANPVKIICRDKAADTLSTGATIANTTSNNSVSLLGKIYVYGLTLNAGRYVNLATQTADVFQTYELCTFGHWSTDGSRAIKIGGTDTSDSTSVNGDFINCTFNPESNPIRLGARGMYRYHGCTFNLETAAGFIAAEMHGSFHRFEGCNFAGDANPTTFFTFDTGTGTYGECHIRNSKLPGAITTANGASNTNQQLFIENSATGAVTDPPLGLNWLENPFGTIKSTLAKYRTGGADDEEQANAYSWEMISSTRCIEGIRCLESPPISRWVDGGSAITSKLFFAGGATLNDDDLAVIWKNPDQTASPNATALHEHTSSRITDVGQGTPAAHTTDSASTWNGTGVGTKQEDSITYTPTNAGHTYARVQLFKPSTTVYVDPQMVNS